MKENNKNPRKKKSKPTLYLQQIFFTFFSSENRFFHIWKQNISKYFLSIFSRTDYSYS